MLWPEVSRLIAPEAGLRGGGQGTPQPVAGWGSPGSGSIGVLGFSPAADPLRWMDTDFKGVRFERWGTLIYRARRDRLRSSDISADRTVVHASTPIFGDDFSLMLGGTATGSVTRIELRDDSGYLRRDSAETHTWLGIRAGGDGWKCLLSWGQLGYFHGAGEAAAAFGVVLREGTKVSVWASRRVADDGMAVVYKGDDAFVIAPFAHSAVGLDLSGVIGRWPLRFRAERTEGSGRGSEEPMHRLRPRPRLLSAELRAKTPSGRWQAALGLGWGKHRADLESQGLRYGRFLLCDDRLWTRVAWETKWKRWALQLWSGFSRTEFEGEGDLEFWPFTPTIIDLLGLRRRAVTDAVLSVVSTGGRGTLLGSEGSTVILGMDLHHLWTDGRLESWEPLVLGVGRRNVLSDRLSVRSAQLIDLGIQYQSPLVGGLVLQGGVAQLVPLAVQKRLLPEVPPPVEPAEVGAVTEWGGLRWWVTFLLNLSS